MRINQFAVYQVKEEPAYRHIQFSSYEELLQKKVRINSDSYNQVYISRMLPGETMEQVHERLRKKRPKTFQGHSISTSDVYVMNQDGIITSYYVDKERLINFTGFFQRHTSDALISMDTVGYVIEGKGGTWVSCENLIVEGKKFFLMQSERYGSDAEGVVLAEDGSVVVDGCREFDEKTVNQIRIFLHPPPETKKPDAKPEETSVKISEEENCWPISENAEEAHNKKTVEEQQMDEIERRINSLPEPRTINGRVSVLDRLHIIQAKRAIREGKKPPRIGAEQKVKRKKKQ
ncbi:MAG: YodL domain-containing protein [Lachnospiraceae bacterium]|nr:YodL domain-containing protein [Lachnospiraceae bacterium]